MNKPITNGRVTRWLLLLQEFNITILDRPGKQNTVANFLSRIQNIKDNIPVEDKFPNEYIFVVTTCWLVLYSFHIVNRGFEGYP